MATPEELLRKLEERFIVGEISAEQYQPIHDRLAAQVKAAREAAEARDSADPTAPDDEDATSPAPATGSAGGMSISDSVIKGNVTSGAASVGNITINLAKDQAGGSNAELEYERYVLVALRSGGQLNSIRKDLDERRQALGLTMRLAREIEQACQMSVGGLYKPDPPAPSQPAGPTPLSKFFKAASQSISTMFAAPPVPQNLAAAPAKPPAPHTAAPAPKQLTAAASAPRAVPPPMPPAAPKVAATPPPVPPPAPPPSAPPLGATPPPMPSPLAATVKSELLTELNADVQKPAETDASSGQSDPHSDGKGAPPSDRRSRPKSTAVPPPMPPPLPRR